MWKRCASLSLCFKCLGTNHKRNECRWAKKCYYCSKSNHSSALCEGRPQASKESSSERVVVKATQETSHNKNRGPKSQNSGLKRNVAMAANDQAMSGGKTAKNGDNVAPTSNNGMGAQLSDNGMGAQPVKLAQPVNNGAVVKQERRVIESVPDRWVMQKEICMTSVEDETPVLLKTRRATIVNLETPFLKEETFVFFDSGSTMSMITNKMAQSLKLPQIGLTYTKIATMDNPRVENNELRQYPLYEAGIRLIDGNTLGIKLHGVDRLPRLDAAQVTYVAEDLSSVELAVGKHEPQLLIGLRHHVKFGFEKVQTFNCGAELYSSYLGPVYGGALPYKFARINVWTTV